VSEVNGQPETRSSQTVRGLVAETGEFYWLLDDSHQQISGTFRVKGADLGVDEDPLWWEYLFWGTGNPEVWGYFEPLGGTVNERVSLTGDFQSSWGFLEYVGNFSLDYDDLYERNSSLASMAGTYTGFDESLTVDAAGVMFYQSSANGCVGNGSAELIDPDFNMYRLAILLEGCTGPEAGRNGFTFAGLAYLGDSGEGARNDVLEFASSATISESAIPFDSATHQFIWSLSIQK
jgi:hypothetical protein